MALPIITDVFRVALKWSTSDNVALTAVNVMHFRGPGKNASDVASALDSAFAAACWDFQTQQSHIFEADITPLDGTSLTLAYTPATVAHWKGGVTSTSPVPAVAAIVKLLTNTRGRSYRGRVFLPWVCEEAMAAGALLAGNVTGAQSAWNTWLSSMGSAGVHPCVASYLHSTSADITSILVESLPATQRRRQPR